jgi:sugar lactone lactonase YvrE
MLISNSQEYIIPLSSPPKDIHHIQYPSSSLIVPQSHNPHSINSTMHLLLPLTTLFASSLAASLSTIYQYPPGTWLENIARMPNNSLLVSSIGSADVHIIDPKVTPATSSLVTSFPGANSVLGITELRPNIFAVAVGNLTLATNTPIEGTFSIWTLDFTCHPMKINKNLDIPNVGLANGITTLTPTAILVADCWKGNIVRVDLSRRSYGVVLEDTTLRSDFTTNASLPAGVNGLKIHRNYLYYTNTVQNLLGRVRINTSTGTSLGRFETIAQGREISQPDDFAVKNDGSVVLARPLADQVMHVSLDGRVETLVKRGLGSGATGVIFGKSEKTLYLSESGLAGGVSVGGGRVVRVEL